MLRPRAGPPLPPLPSVSRPKTNACVLRTQKKGVKTSRAPLLGPACRKLKPLAFGRVPVGKPKLWEFRGALQLVFAFLLRDYSWLLKRTEWLESGPGNLLNDGKGLRQRLSTQPPGWHKEDGCSKLRSIQGRCLWDLPLIYGVFAWACV